MFQTQLMLRLIWCGKQCIMCQMAVMQVLSRQQIPRRLFFVLMQTFRWLVQRSQKVALTLRVGKTSSTIEKDIARFLKRQYLSFREQHSPLAIVGSPMSISVYTLRSSWSTKWIWSMLCSSE